MGHPTDCSVNLELHPLCTLFPRLVGAEFDALKADILANGQREPIVVHEGFILDGGNRYRACVEAGIEPQLKQFSGTNPVSFVLSANLHRRHLTPGQQAAIVASAQDWSMAQSVGNPAFKAPAQKGNVAPLETASDRAAQSGASLRTQKMADKVAKASPELAKQVAHGEISLPKALEQLAPRAPEPQPVPIVDTPDDVDTAGNDEPDLLAELEVAEKEIRRLSQLVDTLSSQSDLARQVAEWSQRFEQLSGRNAQLIRTANEAQAQARYATDLLAKIRKALAVESNSEILSALSARRVA